MAEGNVADSSIQKLDTCQEIIENFSDEIQSLQGEFWFLRLIFHPSFQVLAAFTLKCKSTKMYL